MTIRTIAAIDKEIDNVRRQLRRLENVDQFSAESWQRAWDHHPGLREKERRLFLERWESKHAAPSDD